MKIVVIEHNIVERFVEIVNNDMKAIYNNVPD